MELQATDLIRKSVLDNFTMPTELNLPTVLLTLGLAFVLGLFIVLIYRLTFSGVIFNKSFSTALVMLTMVTAMVIMPIATNLLVALGMVGALSIVRFRTAIKDPLDTIFMFWAIAPVSCWARGCFRCDGGFSLHRRGASDMEPVQVQETLPVYAGAPV